MRIYSNPIFYRHNTGPGHPECADRLDAAFEGVRRAGAEHLLVDDILPSSDTDRMIVNVHAPEYAGQFEDACQNGNRFFHSYDNPISPDSYDAARTVVSTALTAAEDVWRHKTIARSFVVARPPGHHAEKTTAMGFCFFNTIACVAERLRELPGIDRVFILDWDVHHGNGTQAIFDEREDVFYASVHRFPFYPGTGASSEVGSGRGRGCTRNVPLDVGQGDPEFLRAIEQVFVPLIDDYEPQAILVSAGFDAHLRDPIGGMLVTEGAYALMTRMIIEAAERHCEGRLLSLMEGGYDPEGLALSVANHVVAMGKL